MLAYTGVETVSNLAEEVRDPVRSVPNAYKLVAGAVFAIYFTLPLRRALGDAGRARERRVPDDCSGCRRRRAATRTTRSSASSRTSASQRAAPPRDGDLRRRPRRDDPLHRHERGRDRRLADHLLDGHLPADPGGLPPAAPAVQDPVALDRPLRRDRAGRSCCSRATRPSSGRSTRSARPSRSRSRTRRSCGSGCGRRRRRRKWRSAPARTSARAASTGPLFALVGGARDRRLLARHRRAEPADPLGGARLARRGLRLLRRLPAARRPPAARGDRPRAGDPRAGRGRRVHAAARPGRGGPAVRRGDGGRGAARLGAAGADRGDHRARGAAPPAARRGAAGGGGAAPTPCSTRRARSATRTAWT